jgi:hypothetical protein
LTIDLLKGKGWRQLKWKEFAFKEEVFDGWRLVGMLHRVLERPKDGETRGIIQIFEKDGKYKCFLAMANAIYGDYMLDPWHPMESITYRFADVPEDWGGADNADS